MDLMLAHKKASRLGERVSVTLATQTTFSTAVSEVCREVIDRTDSGVLTLGIVKEDFRYFLTALIRYDKMVAIDASEPGYQNAQKLLPLVSKYSDKNHELIELKIGLPRSNKIGAAIPQLIELFATEPPYTAYEAIKRKNLELFERAEEREEALHLSEYHNEQKNIFMSMASHELKTPVTIIKAFAQIALAAGEQHCSPLVHKYLKRIEEQSTKLTSLIQQLLDVSKIESGKLDYAMEEVNWNNYLKETVSLIQHTIPQHAVNVTFGQTAAIKLDKLRVEQVLANIIGNAAKYSKPENAIDVSSNIQNSKIIVSVRDYGIGMQESEMAKIFEKFHRSANVEKHYSGLGMGLYISMKIIREHAGDIWVDSTPGDGSTFHFSLPLATT